MSKISKKVRKNSKVSKALDKAKDTLESKEFHAGRGARKLADTKTVFYVRPVGEARLFFRYSPEERGVVEILAESNKLEEDTVIDILRRNHK